MPKKEKRESGATAAPPSVPAAKPKKRVAKRKKKKSEVDNSHNEANGGHRRRIIRSFNPELDPFNCTCKCGLYLVIRKNAERANCRRQGCGVGVARKEAIKQIDDEIEPTDWYCYNCGTCNRIGDGDQCSTCSFPQSWSEAYDSDIEDVEDASRKAHDAFESGYCS